MNKKLNTLVFLLFPCFAFAENNQNTILSSTFSPSTILSIIVIGFVTYYFHKKFDRFAIQHGPEILTTIGILGCFLGITVGLFSFNSKDINSSIPELIGGIKSAFIASLLGILFALSIKARHALTKKPIPSSEGATKSTSIDDLVASIFQLKQSLVGDEEGTLLSQLKLIRSDTRDQLQKLNSSFDSFATKMSENNQKALIEALNQVIRDFNENLTEQFGENFKHLNTAVGHLVIWQQQYKDELEAIKKMQSQTSLDMQIASNAFATLVQNSKGFAATAENLKNLLIAMNKNVDILFVQEKTMNDVLLQMKNVTPQFSEKVTKMIQDITFGVKQIQSETVEIVKNYGIQTQSANAEMKNLLADVVRKTQKQLSEDLQENSKIIKEGVLTLDKALQKELNDALTSLGKQLASLSEKFVTDYLPLTERLREVVRISSNIQ
jgi:hypothetical protein